MYLAVPATACLLILDSLGVILIGQWASWIEVYKILNHSFNMHTGRYQHQSFWNGGIFSSRAKWNEFLDYELHIKRSVLYVWRSLRCTKNWIVICYRGQKFPQKAVVHLLLESDATLTSLSGTLDEKVQCWF